MRSEGYSTWSVCLSVCLSVCVSVTQHLTFYMIIRATNDTNLLSGEWRLKILSDFLWKCFVAKLGRFLLVRLHDKSAIFYSAEYAHAYESGHVASGHFVLGSDFDCCLLAIGSKYASNKGMPTAVPIRRKTCECCDLVFRFKRKAECNLREKTVYLWNIWEQ